MSSSTILFEILVIFVLTVALEIATAIVVAVLLLRFIFLTAGSRFCE
jgi:hypothetical protein